jgi:tRNA-specific 2-thiouridylase
VSSAGKVLGRHSGYHHFTVGQRRGLGVAGAHEPLYVLRTDAAANRVTVGRREELTAMSVRLRGARLHRDARRADRVKLRYHARAIPCRVADAPAGEHSELRLELTEPAYGVAPGQTACLMDGELVVGRGTIAA